MRETSSPLNERIMLKGISISPGMTFARAVLLETNFNLDLIENYRVTVGNYQDELQKFEYSRTRCIDQIEALMATASGTEGISDILLFQKVLLNDQGMISAVRTRAEKEKVNIEFIIITELKKIRERFERISAGNIKNRFLDVQDIYYRLLCDIMGIEQFSKTTFREIAYPFILVSKQLFPSMIASMNRDFLCGLISEQGSATSHAAIIARSYDIPAVTGVIELAGQLNQGDEVILDGDLGIVIINPHPEEKEKYLKSGKTIESVFFKTVTAREEIKYVCHEQIPFSIECNASSLKDAEEGYQHGASGIGLFRSEFFYMASKTMPDSMEEFNLYKKLLMLKPDNPVTIRLLDVGGDKMPFYLPMPSDPVPQLGFRGIRYLLNYPELLVRQLKNIIPACKFGTLRLLVPFITFLEDFDRTVVYLKEVLEELGIERSRLQVGIMVEIPSVALEIEQFIEKVDFISIGTNDLSQYVFAVSREACQLNGYRCTVHPVILKLIRKIVKCADQSGKEVTVCGEIAGDPFSASLLVGLGVRKLSMNPGSIESVRHKLCDSPLQYFENLAQEAVTSSKFIDILNLLSKN